MTLHTLLAGGPAHGQDILHMAGGSCDLQGATYRYYSGPYEHTDGRSQPYQVFVVDTLDATEAQEAVMAVLRSRLGARP